MILAASRGKMSATKESQPEGGHGVKRAASPDVSSPGRGDGLCMGPRRAKGVGTAPGLVEA